MEKSKQGISAFQYGVVWFGAAVSIAEIEAGRELAGAAKGGSLGSVVAAVILGHVIGGVLLFAAGLIAALSRRNAMECARLPFGGGASLFATLNIVQLVGWTAVMVAQGAAAAAVLLPSVPFAVLASAIGALVAIWIFIGLGGVSRLNSIAMFLLLALAAALSVKLLHGAGDASATPFFEGKEPCFWMALELSVAMPLSWLPLVGDYTRDARSPIAASATGAAIYTLVSCWMYGLGVALAGGEGFAQSVLAAGMGVVGLVVVVLSTVTTTFLDAYSAGESARSLSRRIHPKAFGVGVCVVGTALAIAGLMDRYLDFLYLIASVFAPMAAVLIADWLVGRKEQQRSKKHVVVNFAAWLAGLAAYHVALRLGPPLGATLPAMAVAAAIAAAVKGK